MDKHTKCHSNTEIYDHFHNSGGFLSDSDVACFWWANVVLLKEYLPQGNLLTKRTALCRSPYKTKNAVTRKRGTARTETRYMLQDNARLVQLAANNSNIKILNTLHILRIRLYLIFSPHIKKQLHWNKSFCQWKSYTYWFLINFLVRKILCFILKVVFRSSRDGSSVVISSTTQGLHKSLRVYYLRSID